MAEQSLSSYSSNNHYKRCLFPEEVKKEVKELSALALPVLLSYIMVYLISFVSTVFCGHLGSTELDGVALAIAILNVSSVAVGYGLASACDTLISQTFGSGNLQRVGVIVQRGLIILLLACFPCWAILINTESILLLVKQNPDVAKLSQMYVKIFMPALPALFVFIIESTYLQNQGIIWPLVITGAIANVLNALSNYVFLFVLDLGVPGSAAANTVSQYLMAIVLFIYIRCRGLHKDTWYGWSMECLQEWDTFFHLAIPGLLMLCAEWWTYELGAFLAGLISPVELGAQSIIYELANVAYMFPIGFSVAGCVRVGNAMGAGDTAQAKLSAKLAMACAVSVAVCLAIIVGFTKDVISYIFSNDEQIRARVATVMVLYAPFHLLDATAAAAGSIVRGLGKQKLGAVGNVFGYYAVGFPIGVSLMFAAKMGIFGRITLSDVNFFLSLVHIFTLLTLLIFSAAGLWTGLLICVFFQSVFFITLLSKLNWEKATEEAQIRAGVHMNEKDDDAVQQYEDVGSYEEGTYPDTQSLIQKSSVCTVGKPLSLGALLLRRGLTLAAMLTILAGGLVINVILNR
ncbi:multidrug and toxin extrusion protein 1 isoform X1 [Astyanax mexicanus]|uniref:multidrug and toxin extrusion protein 1 isoform X1 n=1 Tax=Astyanax mexicanus TaxID=7994 RepID=UPI0020CB6461|nr:multidrug and toxin extrusion protein 1 isoform X1 [Astyanax mexicanus]